MSRRMLIVDDEETIRWALREIFMGDGWRVDCAADGDEADGLLQRTTYDFIITDLKMPGVSGTELIRKARRRNPGTGVIVLTGFAALETAVAALRLRAWDYVTKPCEVRYLKQRIDEFLEETEDQHDRRSSPSRLGEKDLRRFLEGGGEEVFSFSPLCLYDGSDEALSRLREILRHLGYDEKRVAELLQVCVEAVALLCDGEQGGAARAGLFRGHVILCISGAAEEEVRSENLEEISTELGVEARLVADGDVSSIVLSERL